MKYINLTKGKTAIVDDEDFELLSQWKWQLYSGGYARRSYRKNGKSMNVAMHRFILKLPKGLYTDHINGNRLDNRKENLRVCSYRENAYNRVKRTGTSSIFKGVYWHKHNKAWLTGIRLKEGKLKVVGYFKNEIHAAMAYDIWAKELYGEFAKLNF